MYPSREYVSGEGVQQALTQDSASERNGYDCSAIIGRPNNRKQMTTIDTTNILFICGGALDGLEKNVEAASMGRFSRLDLMQK